VILLAALATGTFVVLVAAALGGVTPARSRRKAAHLAKTRLWLTQAGVDLAPLSFIVAIVAFGFVALVMFVAATKSPIVSVFPAIAVASLPVLSVSRRRARRMEEVHAAWPDGLRDLVASVASGMSLARSLDRLSERGPVPLRAAFAGFPLMARTVGVIAALEIVKSELADPSSDRVLEVLILAQERGGAAISEILEDLAEAATRDLWALEEIRTESLEQKINARAVFVLPWLVLVALTLRDGAFRDFYRSPAGVLVVTVGAALSALGMWLVARLGRGRAEGLRSRGRCPVIALAVALSTGIAVVAAVSLVAKPMPRLGPRVRPYSVASTVSLGGTPELGRAGQASVVGILKVMLDRAGRRLGRIVDGSSELEMRRKLRQAGLFPTVDEGRRLAEYRLRQLFSTALATGAAFLVATVVGLDTSAALAVGGLGFIVGATRWRGRLDKAIDDRRMRLRIEVYTINQLLSMRVRVGGGVVQAVQYVVSRGVGAMAGELAEALRLHRSGVPASEALARIAHSTPEPHAARTYWLLSSAEERGTDLAGALLALGEDVREARREAIRRAATKRRAAMLIPTIAILAPIMLLFVAAPLPSIVFGGL